MPDPREVLVGVIAGSECDWRDAEKIADAIRAAGWTPPGEAEWEYNIAYPVTDGERFWWGRVGLDPFDTPAAAEAELSRGDYLPSARIVRRRKAGTWEEVPSE